MYNCMIFSDLVLNGIDHLITLHYATSFFDMTFSNEIVIALHNRYCSLLSMIFWFVFAKIKKKNQKNKGLT
jgi:hypothetical protein